MTPAYEAAWTRAEPFFRKALKYAGNLWTLDEVKALIEEGEAHFWFSNTGYVVTQFSYSPRVKLLNFWLLGGDLDGLEALLPSIEVWAIQNDCLVFMGTGRRGFMKRFAPLGYKPKAVTLIKDMRRALL